MRRFTWWCPNCKTILRLETEEYQDDEAREVDAEPQARVVHCLLCPHQMEDVENLTMLRPPGTGWPDGEWAAFRKWQEGGQQ